MNFTDTVAISGTRKREDGYLVVDARIARTGVQRYLGSEVGKPDIPFIDVYRPPEEVFNTAAMASFAHRPVTDEHPSEAVTADNWSTLAKGQTAGEIQRDGEFLRVPLMIADASTIAKVEGGKKELSAGYTCDLKFESGVTPSGETYDAIQTEICANHLAIVQAGRAGKECRIGDGSVKTWGLSPYINDVQKGSSMEKLLRDMMVDGLPVQTTDAGAIAIEKLMKDRLDLQTLISTNQAAFDAKFKEKEEELEKEKAKTDDALSKVLDQTAIDKLIASRSSLEVNAKAIVADVKTDGLSDSDVRKAVVAAKLGNEVIKDKESSYIDARFDILVETAKDAKPDQFRDALNTPVNGAIQVNQNDANAVRQAAFDAMVHHSETGAEMKVN